VLPNAGNMRGWGYMESCRGCRLFHWAGRGRSNAAINLSGKTVLPSLLVHSLQSAGWHGCAVAVPPVARGSGRDTSGWAYSRGVHSSNGGPVPLHPPLPPGVAPAGGTDRRTHSCYRPRSGGRCVVHRLATGSPIQEALAPSRLLVDPNQPPTHTRSLRSPSLQVPTVHFPLTTFTALQPPAA